MTRFFISLNCITHCQYSSASPCIKNKLNVDGAIKQKCLAPVIDIFIVYVVEQHIKQLNWSLFPYIGNKVVSTLSLDVNRHFCDCLVKNIINGWAIYRNKNIKRQTLIFLSFLVGQHKNLLHWF